jgi:hypothetical protein
MNPAIQPCQLTSGRQLPVVPDCRLVPERAGDYTFAV